MSTDDRWYFAYGSNLSKERMQRRTGPIAAARVAQLKDFRLAFNNTDTAGAERLCEYRAIARRHCLGRCLLVFAAGNGRARRI